MRIRYKCSERNQGANHRPACPPPPSPSPPPLHLPPFFLTPTTCRTQVTEPSQVQGATFALQIGVDALLLRPNPDLWTAGRAAREQRNAAAAEATVPGGVGAVLSSGSSGSPEGVRYHVNGWVGR